MAFLAAAAIACCGSVALSGCGSAELVYTLSEDGTHYIVSVSGSASALTEAEIAEEYEGLPVTEIASMGFYGCSNLSSIVIPDSITTIGYSAFVYCKKLTSVTLSQNLTSIPRAIFGQCMSLTSVEIPASVTEIDDCAFMYSYLTSITIPETVESVGANCFYGNTKLETADIQCELSVIPYGMFYNCTSLTSVILPASVTEIKGDEETQYTDSDGNTTDVTYFGAFSYGYISTGSNTIVYDYELENIYFRGSESQWNAITFGSNAAITENTVITYNYN